MSLRFVLVLLLLGACAPASRVSLEIAPAPALAERSYAGFWDAALALDYDRAELLANSAPERAYALALRRLAEGDLPAAQDLLSGLTADAQVEPRARALLGALAKESDTLPEKAFSSRVDRSFVEALLEARKAERWRFGPEPARLLVDRGGSPTPRVPVRVNGLGALMGIDTGAGLTVIGSDLARAAGARFTGARTRARDAHGEGVQAELAVVNLDLGGIVVERHPVIVIDSARLRFKPADSEITGFEGVLGWNALSALRTTLDNTRQTVTFEKSPGRARGAGDLFWIGEPYVRARGSNGYPLLLFLDTGASHTALSTPAALGAGLGAGERGKSLVMGAAGSRTIDVTLHRDATLYAGGSRIAFGEMQSMELRSTGYAVRDGVLGADALVRGTVVIDPGSREFLITP